MVYQIVSTMRYPRLFAPFAPAAALALAACGDASARPARGPVATVATGPRAAPTPPASPAPPAPSPASPGSPAAPTARGAAVARPSHRLTIPEARRYMLALVNRDRASQGVGPVELDEGAPTVAGQGHAEDMARLGFLGHWGSDGSVPEHRHTLAGGADMVMENASCVTDEARRTLDPKATIDPAAVEHAESLFFDEVPPNDGHRRNILKPGHRKVGIGVAQPVATATEIPTPCFTQEFVDPYGTYTPLPTKAKVGATVHVEATLIAGARPTGVGVARVARPEAMTPAELNKRRSYPVPRPYQMYWGPGFVSPLPVRIEGQKLAIDVPLSEKGQPGLYLVSVWGKLDGSADHAMLGLRTILVE